MASVRGSRADTAVRQGRFAAADPDIAQPGGLLIAAGGAPLGTHLMALVVLVRCGDDEAACATAARIMDRPTRTNGGLAATAVHTQLVLGQPRCRPDRDALDHGE
jgi:hypothetical protein